MNIGPFNNLHRVRGIPHYWTGTMTVNDVPFNVDCVEVQAGSGFAAVNAGLEKYLEALASFDDGCRYQTLDIKGKPHVVLVYPFQE